MFKKITRFLPSAVTNNKYIKTYGKLACQTQSRNWRNIGDLWLLLEDGWPFLSRNRCPNDTHSFSIRICDKIRLNTFFWIKYHAQYPYNILGKNVSMDKLHTLGRKNVTYKKYNHKEMFIYDYSSSLSPQSSYWANKTNAKRELTLCQMWWVFTEYYSFLT